MSGDWLDLPSEASSVVSDAGHSVEWALHAEVEDRALQYRDCASGGLLEAQSAGFAKTVELRRARPMIPPNRGSCIPPLAGHCYPITL